MTTIEETAKAAWDQTKDLEKRTITVWKDENTSGELARLTNYQSGLGWWGFFTTIYNIKGDKKLMTYHRGVDSSHHLYATLKDVLKLLPSEVKEFVNASR